MSSSKMRATQHYVYSESDSAGRGATCEVFKGINKSTGQIHALKVFEHKLRGVSQREIDALKKLKHKNVVEFKGEEMDMESRKVVAVMEYCEKSLYNVLCEPENRYGIPEVEYLRFFRHIVEGMKHLRENDFLHRDIKPGNILLAQEDDGRYIYKLSDFGTAKPVLETEQFQSLVGTEEYLHPNIFRAAFIDQKMDRQFDAAADLWSLGATLYHTACGKVPFQPYHGRHDRGLMFQMIAKKPYGTIAGEQRSQGGEVIWHKELPATCRMSRWLKAALTDIMAKLLENDPQKAMTFETFFQAADDILDRHVVYVFSTTSAKHFTLYMSPDVGFNNLQQEIYEETNILPKDQLISYEECFLRDIVKDTDPLSSYPKLSRTSPLVLIRASRVEDCIMPEESQFWYKRALSESEPTFSESIKKLDEDIRGARHTCETVAFVQYLIDEGCLTQELFEKTINRTERWKEILINRLETEVNLYKDRVRDLRHIHAAIMASGGITCMMPSDGVSLEDLKMRIHNCTGYLKVIQNSRTDDGGHMFLSGCVDGNRCQKKVARLLERAKAKRDVFQTRKKRGMPYHEEQLHKFDRGELLQIFKQSQELWSTHCLKKLSEVHEHFLAWHRDFAKLQTHIEALQREIRGTKASIKNYTRHFKEVSNAKKDLKFNVESDRDSLVSVPDSPDIGSMVTGVCTLSLNQSVNDQKRRQLAASLVSQLDAVKSDQEEMRSLMEESQQAMIRLNSIADEDDMATMTED